MQTKSYTDFLATWGALVGVPAARISTELEPTARAQLNAAMRKGWKTGNLIDLCPYGEARFVGNRLAYPNDLAQTTSWTATNLSLTARSIANPCDARVTATKALETVTNGAHNAAQSSLTFFPLTSYLVSVYARQNGRDDIRVAVNDGTTTHSAFFDINAATVGTTSNTDSTTCMATANGFVLCQFSFTTGSTAGTGSVTLSLSTDGSTLSYAGDTTKGVYLWGALLQQTSNIGPQDALLAWDQTGESVIETVFELWRDPPTASYLPREQPFELTPNGIQVISTGAGWLAGASTTTVLYSETANPVYVYYRKKQPNYTGDEFDATATYAVDDQIYFVDSDDVGNFYKCLAATSAGQDPEDTPSKWELLEIPEVLFDYAVYRAYGDWLISDGQMEKSAGAYAIAKDRLDDELDRQERAMGWVQPMRVSTHVTSQPRF